MSTVQDLFVSSASGVRIRRVGLAGSLAVLALLGACAAPMTTAATATGDYSAPASYSEYGTVRHIDVVDTPQAVATGDAVVGNDVARKQTAAASGRHYRVVVDLDDGGRRAFDTAYLESLEVGGRVRVQGDTVIPLLGM
jgi:hypothetical protein